MNHRVLLSGLLASKLTPIELRCRAVFLTVSSVVLSCSWPALGSPEHRPSEYEVKAACFFLFAKFVEWPASAFADANAPVVFAVLGEDPFGDILERTIAGKKAQNRGVEIKRFRSPEELDHCHLLFVSSSLKDRFSEVLRAIKGRPVATVGETAGLGSKGAVFNFFIREDAVKFEVNLDAARRAELTVSSKLLKVGVVVEDEAQDTRG